MGMRSRGQVATVERILVMIEDMLLVEFFFTRGDPTNGAIQLTMTP